jgi:pre-mRNA-splicing factor SPF27
MYVPQSTHSTPQLTNEPDIDAPPTASAHARAQQLINAELPKEHSTTLHPWIPESPQTNFTPIMQQELERKATNAPLTGIDLSRYEAPEAPVRASDTDAPDLDAWRETLQKAYASSSHLSKRHENLALLEEFGKNAWLIGNSQLEEILGGLERELAETKEAAAEVNKERKIAQEASHGELVGLEETWKRGVGAILDVEVASEGLRMQILEHRRQVAQQAAR